LRLTEDKLIDFALPMLLDFKLLLIVEQNSALSSILELLSNNVFEF